MWWWEGANRLSSSPKRPERKKPNREAKPSNGRRAQRRIAFPSEHDPAFSVPDELPLLPLRDVVVFPGMVLPLLVGRPASVVAIERGVEDEKLVFVTAQKDPQDSEPDPEDLHDIGVAVRLLQVLRLPDNTIKV